MTDRPTDTLAVVPTAPLARPAADVSAEPAETPAVSPLAIALRRWPLLVVGLAVGAVLGVIIQLVTPPTYQSSAQVIVVKKRTDVIGVGDVRTGVVDDYVSTQVTLIKSQEIRLAAVQRLRKEPMNVPLPADDVAAADSLSGGLSVIRDKESLATGQAGSSVLVLTYRGPDPADTRRVLDAVIDTYKEALYSLYEQATLDRIKSLDGATEAHKVKRKKADEERISVRTEIRKITTEDVASIRVRVAAQKTQQLALQTSQIELDEQMKLIEGAGKNRRDRLAALIQLNGLAKPGGGSPLEQAAPEATLRVLLARKKELSQEFGKDHPKMKEVEAQIGFYKDEIARQNPDNPSGQLDELAAFGARTAQQLKTVQRQLDALETQLKGDEVLLTRASAKQDRVDALAAEVAQEDLELARLASDRLTVQSTQTGGGYNARAITPPANGGKIGPSLVRSLMTGIAVGLLLGAGAVAAAEFTDKSFRSPEEIRRRLGLPIMGFVPHIRVDQTADAGTAANLSPSLAAAVRPKSGESEAFRGLRTQLYFSTQGRGHQVIQVTSPNPGDGKSTTAANLAVSIAQSGKRVVLLDADFRKPRIHKLFGMETGDAGLAGVVSGEATVAGAVRPSGVANLDVMPCGPRPGNPAELLTSSRFIDVLTELKALYDVVLIDSPPLLAVSDPAAIAPRVDGVLMVFRMTKRARPAAERAREQLAALGANVLGVVVNGWSGDRRGGYGGYGYGYGYGYNYGYGYGGGYKYVDYQYADDYADASSPELPALK